MKKLIVLIVALSLLALTACNKKQESSVLKVGATPVPHAEILELVKDDLAKEGITLEIVEFTDYVTPNIALDGSQIEANFFQHQPYLDSFVAERGLKLKTLAGIHVEPLGLYSIKFKTIDKLKDGAVIAIPNDPTNEGRALLLLQAKGIIKLNETAGLAGTPNDIVENPKKLTFRELDAAQLPRVLNDVDGAIINGNFAMEAKLNPMNDAVILEGAESPYVNIVVIREGMEADPRLQALVKALKSEEVRKFITESYAGGVVPIF
ncbi:MAG: MetQ/NlpA family ABC transporter substrate-binding protein [Deferribacteraceae bacterium]|jgi:D-methionine transport system substrate-binding protein|nr:MetQ/NlpA family ABC transporter substrate-binding protein [Deferribacteraceae bacterium]